MIGITSYGAYIPRLRLSRMKIIEEMAWYSPVIMSVADGEKSVANWDEDALTMAVDAAGRCLSGQDRTMIDGFYLASTTLPFADMQNVAVAAAALNIRESGVRSADFTGSTKAGTTAMIASLAAVQSGAQRNVLVAASDQRRTKMGTMLEMFLGDGAAALQFGRSEVIAEFMGSHSVNCLFPDHYRGAGKEFDYTWEERWVRDEGYGKIIPLAVREYLSKTGLSIGDYARVIYPCYFTATHRAIARDLAIEPGCLQDNLHRACGDTGTAHPLLMLAMALEEATPGNRFLLVGFGQGCDILDFRVTDGMSAFKRSTGVKNSLARRKELAGYLKYGKFRELIAADLGIRGEANPAISLTSLWRNRKMFLGLMGGKCRRCGTTQFSATKVCVNPDCRAIDDMDDYCFSDKDAVVFMYTGDLLAPSVDPPAVYGMVEFRDGARMLLDFTDCSLEELYPGIPVALSFRVKASDRQRGFARYFWKAVPKPDDRGEV